MNNHRLLLLLRNGFVVMLHTAKEDVKEQQHIAACNVSNRDRLGPARTNCRMKCHVWIYWQHTGIVHAYAVVDR